jgi:hypothetical protein
MDLTAASPVERRENPSAWDIGWEFLSIMLLAGAALTAYIIHKRHQVIP